MSVNSKMTALADEIRTLSGTTDSIGLDAMAEHVADANTEISSQDTLIDQAIEALEGKAAGGSGDSIETCTVNIGSVARVAYATVENGVVVHKSTIGTSTTSFICEVVCNTVIYVGGLAGSNINISSPSGVTLIYQDGNHVLFGIDLAAGESVNINIGRIELG